MRRFGLALCAALLVSVALPSSAAAATLMQTWPVGNEPWGVTVDPRDGTTYVAISNSNNSSTPENMYVIDPRLAASSFPPASIALPAPQVMSVLDTTLDRLFVTLANGSIAVVDVRTRRHVMTILNAGMLGAALDPQTHYVYAALGYGGIAMTDGTSGIVLHRASGSGDAYWNVVLDVGRQRLYATNASPAGPVLVAFDARTLTEVGRVPLPEIPRFALAVDEARGVVYVSGFNTETGFPGSHLYAVDEASLEITKSIDVGLGRMAPFSITYDPMSSRLFVSDMSETAGELVIMDAASFSVVERTPLAWQPGQSALHPDGRLYVAGFSSDWLAQLDVERNHAPVIDGWTVSTLSPRTNDTVTTNVVAHDPDGDPIAIGYQWWVNTTNVAGQQQPIPGATTPTLDLSQPGHGDLDDLLCISIDISDGQLHTTNLWCFAFVVDTAPTVTVSLVPASPTTNETVHATAVGGDADLTPIMYTYTWTVNGATRRTATTSATTDDFDLSLPSDGEKSDVVAVTVIASDGRLSSPGASASVVVANSPPLVSVALSTTTPTKRDVVTATAVGSDPDGDALMFTFTWRLRGLIVQTTTTSAPTSTFDLRKVQPDYGAVLSVDVTAVDGSAQASTSASAVITKPNH